MKWMEKVRGQGKAPNRKKGQHFAQLSESKFAVKQVKE
jgi:hypothetical protein